MASDEFKTKPPKFLYAVFAHEGSIVTSSIAFRRSEAIERFMAQRQRSSWLKLSYPRGGYRVKKFEVRLCQ